MKEDGTPWNHLGSTASILKQTKIMNFNPKSPKENAKKENFNLTKHCAVNEICETEGCSVMIAEFNKRDRLDMTLDCTMNRV